MTPVKSQDIVFEIGTEELPATNLADIFSAGGGSPPEADPPRAGASVEDFDNVLKAKWKKLFEDHRIAYESAEVWATPRRLVFFLKNAASSQSARDQFTKLMAQTEAFGADGKPTEKFLTILKHRNVGVEETVVQDLGGKPTVFIKKTETVRKSVSVLPEILEPFVKSLGFPKNMKWDESGLYFPRPIRSTLCFYGTQCMKYRIADTRAGDKTLIFSKAKRTAILVTSAASYFKALEKGGVVLDQWKRKKSIQAGLEKLARTLNGQLVDDPFLMNEVNFLVENPQTLSAPFDAKFLELPKEVLTVSMARKQRIFGLVDKDQRVLPKFLAVADRTMTESEKKLISRNYENILHAKLQDSLFFYKEDTKAPLEKRRQELGNLIFLKGVGSMLQKSERLEHLADKLGPAALDGEDVRRLKRAAFLSKCDLLTQMVGEFPELQGIMGMYYAKESHEDVVTATAIGEQYLPRTVSDRLPETVVGALLSLFDKADLIGACFSLGLQPSSSMDPYALRRSASAIFKILIKHSVRLDILAVVRQNLDLLKSQIPGLDAGAVEKKLWSFLQDRFRSVLVDQGFASDVVDSVLACGFSDIAGVFAKVSALSKARDKAGFLQAAKVIERTTNILKGNKETLPGDPDPALFTEALEHAVMARFQEREGAIVRAKKEGDFARATSLYAEAFFDILNEFFDKVFINAEDFNVRRNRLTLLRNVKDLYTRDIADLSKIQTSVVREGSKKGV